MRFARHVAIAALFLGLFCAAWTAADRVARLDAGSTVALVLDYNRLERVAALEGADFDIVAAQLRDAGVDGLIVRDRTLAELETLGRVEVAWGWELRDRLRLQGQKPPSSLLPQRVYVRAVDPALMDWLGARLVQRWPYETSGWMRIGGSDWIGLTVPLERPVEPGARPPVPLYADDYSGPYPRELMMFPLGVESATIERVGRLGMHVGVEISDPAVRRDAAAAADRRTAAGAAPPEEAAWWRDLERLPPGALVVFKNGTVPGGADGSAARALAERNWRLGLVWGRATPGLRRVAEGIPERLVKVHPLWPEEPLDSILNGVEERFERVLYYQRFVTLRENLGASASSWVRSVERTLQRAGYATSGWPQPLVAGAAPRAARAGSLLAVIGALALVIGGAGRRGAAAASATLATGLLLVGLVYGEAVPTPPLFWQAAAWLAAAVFPVLAIRLALAVPKGMQPATGGVVALGIATLVTVAGGLALQALLADPRFVAQLLQFRGVQLALVAPSLWLCCAGIQLDRSAVRRCLVLMNRPVRFGQVLGLGLGTAVLALALLRTGNFPLIPVPDLELELRTWLDRVLAVRPRTKEFLFGHPLLFVVAAWAALNRTGSDRSRSESTGGEVWRWLLPLAAVGQASVINTFAHVHTPLAVSLLRTLNGAWLGGLLGLVAWIGLSPALLRRGIGLDGSRRSEAS